MLAPTYTMRLEIPTNLREKVEASLMSRVLTFINNLKVAHKIAIVVFVLGCLAFASKDVSKKYDMYENFLKLDYQQCQKDNPNDRAATVKCQLSKAEQNKKQLNKSLILEFVGIFIFAIVLFPLYLIFYNIFYILKLGYKNYYEHSKIVTIKKLFHFSGIAYLSIVLLALIIYHENALVRAKMGNHLPSNSFIYTDFKQFDENDNSALLMAGGVWTNNAIPIENLKFGDIDSDNYVTKIECWKDKGKCDHANGDVTIGTDYHLTQVDYQESQIEYWGADKIVSAQNSSCVNKRYTFDLKTELVTREEFQNEDAPYRCGGVDPTKFTLSDGTEFETAIEINEAGPVTRALTYVLRSIFQ